MSPGIRIRLSVKCQSNGAYPSVAVWSDVLITPTATTGREETPP